VKRQSLLFVVLLFLSTFSAFAEQFDWGNTYAQAWAGFGTGPYKALGSGANANITIFCVDFNDEIGPPFTWDATVRNLTPGSVQTNAQYGGNYNNLLNTAYGGVAPNQISGAPYIFVTDDAGGGYKADLTNSPDAYSRYLEAAWLFSELQDAGPQSQLALIAQVAAWDLFVNPSHIGELTAAIQGTGGTYGFTDYIDPFATATPNIAGGLTFEQAVDYALNAAQAAVVTNKTFTGAGWTIVTADASWVESADGKTIPAQEFLSPNAVASPVPEPTSIVLFCSVVGMAGWLKRRKVS
jgi:hypothetical protein